MEIELVTRRGCHLCEDALDLLRGLGVEPRQRDVDAEAELFALYDFRVPVVLVDGRVVGEGRLDPEVLRRALTVSVDRCGPEAAETVHRLTQAAFRDQATLAPPSGAGRETVEDVREDLRRQAGALGTIASRPVACMRFTMEPDRISVRRLAVPPELQGRGIGRAMMAWAESEAERRGAHEVTVGVRLALEGNIAFFRRLGYEPAGEGAHPGYDRPTWLTMRKRL